MCADTTSSDKTVDNLRGGIQKLDPMYICDSPPEADRCLILMGICIKLPKFNIINNYTNENIILIVIKHFIVILSVANYQYPIIKSSFGG